MYNCDFQVFLLNGLKNKKPEFLVKERAHYEDVGGT